MKQIIQVMGMCVCFLVSGLAAAWTPFVVFSSSNPQQWPSVSGDIVVWQEYVEYVAGQPDWDVYGVDVVNAPSVQIMAAAYEANQTRPCIWGPWVVWEDNTDGDLDIWLSDIRDTANISAYHLSPYTEEQSYPRVHGNTVVWQDFIAATQDWDVYAADVTDPAAPLVYAAGAFDADQMRPDVYRSRVVWQDTYYGDEDIESSDVWRRDVPDFYVVSEVADIAQSQPAADGDYVVWQEDDGSGNIDLYGAEVSDPAGPKEFLICAAAGSQNNPRVSGHLVVWQDNRNGNWDLFGYNLVTREEFQITGDAYNQTRPDIDGTLVVFEDDRSGVSAIYGVRLDGALVAGCPTPIDGDSNGDCQVDLNDLMTIAAQWLVNGLTE